MSKHITIAELHAINGECSYETTGLLVQLTDLYF